MHLLNSLIIKSMQINIFQYISLIIGLPKNRPPTLLSRLWGDRYAPTATGAVLNSILLREGNVAKSIRITNAFTCWHSNPISKNLFDELPADVWINGSTKSFIEALLVIPNNHTKHPSIRDWLKKLWYIHTMKYKVKKTEEVLYLPQTLLSKIYIYRTLYMMFPYV